jgi:hypothetical protein
VRARPGQQAFEERLHEAVEVRFGILIRMVIADVIA